MSDRKLVTPSDKFSVAEVADIFGFPVPALVAAINHNIQSLHKSFYSISDLAARWGCSRATVYNILRESEFKILNAASKRSTERNKWRVPAAIVEHLEKSRMEIIPAGREVILA